MDIFPCGARATRRAPEDYFSGEAWLDPLVNAAAPARVNALLVTFAPGGRTAWHTHPLGQTLHVVSGCGLVQTEGEPARTIRAGDTVWIPPGEKHWHGAGPTTGMVHLAIQEMQDGKGADWLEKVSEEDYAAASRAGGDR